MLSKFTTVPLEDLATFEMGQSPPSIYVSEDNIGLPFLQGNAEFGAIYPNHIYHCSKPKKLCRPQDVLISVRAPVGALNKADQVYVIGRGLAAIKFTEIESDFGWHLLNHWARDLQQVAQGSTFKAINKDNLATLQVLLPPLPEQHRIAEILDAADDAIRQTERVVAKLRQAKAGLLHDLLTCGLDAHGHLRDPDAHPEQFKDSPLGRIPREWGIRPLADLANIDRGKFTHRPRNDPAFYGGVYPFIQTGDITSAAGGIITTYSQKLNERGISVSREFPTGTIAITIAANIADTAILGIPMYFPDSIVGAIVQPPHNGRYVELCIRKAKTRLEAQAPQSAQKNINLGTLRPLLLPIPEPREQEQIAAAYTAADARIRAEEATLAKLRQVKRGLMDDLLTGRVRVK